MRWFRRFRERDLDDEMTSHIEETAEQLEREGLPREQALAEARRRFGSMLHAIEAAREQHVPVAVESLMQDLRYAARSLRRNPGFAAVALLTLALGIGATTAIFSVVDGILLKPLPYPEPERLISVGVTLPHFPIDVMVSADYIEWRDQTKLLDQLAVSSGVGACDLQGGDGPVRLRCGKVSREFLPMLGVLPVLGRNFTREECLVGGPDVVVLGYGTWKTRFGADPQVIGRSLRLDGRPVVVVGVLPAQFEDPSFQHVDLLRPVVMDEAAELVRQRSMIFNGMARLRRGVSIERARSEFARLLAKGKYPAEFRNALQVRVAPLKDRYVGDVARLLWVVFGSAACVLLIAAANFANLLLARATAREHEGAIRFALGAGRLRLLRQRWTESLLLALGGGVAGLLVAWGVLRALIAVGPAIPRVAEATLDVRVLLFAVCVSVVVSLFGMLHPAAAIRNGLIVSEIAASMVLLVGATLLGRSLWNLRTGDIGVLTEHIASSQVPKQRMADVEKSAEAIPGTIVVAFAGTLPPGFQSQGLLQIEGKPAPRPEMAGAHVDIRNVSPAYFRTMGIPLRRGRLFVDAPGDQHSVVLNETLARGYFPGEDPIGKRVAVAPPPPGPDGWNTVVGVVADVRNNGLRNPVESELYRPIAVWGGQTVQVIVRSNMDSRAAAAMLKAELRRLDPDKVIDVATMEGRLDEMTAQPRFSAMLVSSFALVALVLAMVGVYGVLSFAVTRRTREIGIRVALGATPQAVRTLVVRHTLRLALIGAVLGLGGALAAGRWIEALLYDVSARDPLTYLLATGSLLAAAWLASTIPAHRAARLDPSRALRYE